jgi:ketosteroid isomerase-like protein
MSAKLDLVRSIYTAWERGDWTSAEWAHPEMEVVYADGPSPGRWTGLPGTAAGLREVLNVWDDFRVAVDEDRELDDERVLVLYRLVGRGKTSGLDLGRMDAKCVHLFRVRAGKVTTIVVYWDRDRALADLANGA